MLRSGNSTSAMTPRQEGIITVATALAVLLVLGYRALRFGLLGDELLFMHAINLGFPDSLMAAGSSHPPLLRAIVDAITDPATAPDWLLRLPSVLFAVACVPVWQKILRHLFASTFVRCALLPAIALNNFWLSQAFQCLPYSPLVFFASLHCLAWIRFTEQTECRHRLFAVICTGCVLPWTHFFGINVLIVSQLLWLYLIWQKQTSIRTWLYSNLALFVLTSPVVPLAVFYLVHDRAYPLAMPENFTAYFVPGSSYCFSKVTFSGIETTQPLFLVFYAGIVLHLVRSFRDQRNSAMVTDQHKQVTSIVFMMAGLTFAQFHSLTSQAAMWPRYMLGGSWIHLPVIAILLTGLNWNRIAAAFSVVAAALSIGCIAGNAAGNAGTDYTAIVQHIQRHQNTSDAFLVQSMDLWNGANHFDQIWYRRYGDGHLPIVSGVHKSRTKLFEQGLNLNHLETNIQRVWVYSHLFKQAWVRNHVPSGWKLAEITILDGPFPVMLLERSAEASDMQSAGGLSQRL